LSNEFQQKMFDETRFNPALTKNELDDQKIDKKANRVVTVTPPKKTTSSAFKLFDSGFRSVERRIQTSQGYRNVSVEFFLSGDNGTPIRNAITGHRSSFRVGTSDGESQFFKVAVAMGELPNDKVTLFYDSPEEFERHQLLEVDPRVKEAWRERAGQMVL